MASGTIINPNNFDKIKHFTVTASGANYNLENSPNLPSDFHQAISAITISGGSNTCGQIQGKMMFFTSSTTSTWLIAYI